MKLWYLFLGVILVLLFGCAEDAKIKSLIEKANYCDKADDCIVEQFGCPFGCNSIVNKNANIQEIKEVIEKYRSSKGGEVCMYSCIEPPKEIVCQLNKCFSANGLFGDLKIQVNKKLEDSSSCEADKDCSIFNAGCHFGCFHGINKNTNIDDLKEKINQYEMLSSLSCLDSSCGSVPSQAICKDKRCIIKEIVEENINKSKSKDIECNSNIDCATGGCSNELCGKKGVIDSIMTNCLYKQEYDCLRKTSCGCVSSKCQWIENDEYNKCLNSLK